MNTCLFILFFFSAGTMFSRMSLTARGILSETKYIVLMAVSGKNPFSPNKASTVGSNPFPSIPICRNKIYLSTKEGFIFGLGDKNL